MSKEHTWAIIEEEQVRIGFSDFMSVGGGIIAVNKELENDLELVNNYSNGEGWAILVEPHDLKKTGNLLTKEEYVNLLKG